MQFIVINAEAMERLGQQIAGRAFQGNRLYLQGKLGTGKTTFVRGFMRGMDHQGKVKSPTYTLVETYTLSNGVIHHFDFYRLHEPKEVEDIGIRDYFDGNGICLVEWPEKAATLLPTPDIQIHLRHHPSGRDVRIEALTAAGQQVLVNIADPTLH